ncbi:ParA family protein [Candidatus Hydrogenosomobacter endosymbioticus]|uniref:ParA family protein n=1 Tax=Candidatus Hydrogenosomobacter endosymbioticus TaxID=2558174 RepID=UPI001F263EAE|nr:ParA family protein [Candidatus Hydrogenosomobacter endosymbioticus]
MKKNSAIVVGILNQKGGVGKTSTAVNLATALAIVNKKVLLVDLDPQGNASMGFGLKVQKGDQNVYHVILRLVDIKSVLVPCFIANLDILCSASDLAGAEIELVPLENRESQLAYALKKVTTLYDYIIIDCPPSLGLLSLNALIASTCVIIPVQCEFFALDGLSRLLNTIKKTQKVFNSKVYVAGILLTMYDGRNLLNQQVEKEVRSMLGEDVFLSVIPRNVKISEASSHGKPAIIYDRRAPGAKAYIEFAREFLIKQGETLV